MGLFAKRILRDPFRTLEGNQVISATGAVTKDPEASQISNRDKHCRLQKKASVQTDKTAEEEPKPTVSVNDEDIPACLRSYCPDPKGGYWDRDVSNDKKRKRTTVDRLVESVTAELNNKVQALETSDEAKPTFKIPRKTRISSNNPPNGPPVSFLLPKKLPASMANPRLPMGLHTRKKKDPKLVGPSKSSVKSFEVTNHCSQDLPTSKSSSSSFLSYYQQPPSIGWKTASSLPMEETRKKRKKKKKKRKKKKIPKRKIKLEEEITNKQLADLFRASIQAAEDFMNTEQGSLYRSKKSGDEDGPVILL